MHLFRRIVSYFESKAFRPTLSLWRTVYLNLRTLPLRQAVGFPLLVYGKWDFPCLDGRITLAPDVQGRIRLGYDFVGYQPQRRSKLLIMGGVII